MTNCPEMRTSAELDLLSSVVDNIQEGIILADDSCKIIFMNAAAKKLTGCESLAIACEQWSEFFGCYKDDGKTLYELSELPLYRAIQGEEIDNEEMILNNDRIQRPIWVSISGRQFAAVESNTKGAVITFRDVTFKKQAEVELKRSNEELSRFAYVAAHDLQEPLRTINGYLQLLSQKYEKNLDEKANRYITHAVTGAQRLENLVRDLLLYSRVASRAHEFTYVKCNDVVDRVLSDLRSSIEEAQAKVICSDLPVIAADERHMQQLFQNLIANAIKYRGHEPVQVQINCRKEGINWVFSVKDNGIGFEMEYVEKIFLVFQRLHGRTEYAGNGIGLALCRRIVERHQGRIWATSELGKGSEFFFSIPIHQLNAAGQREIQNG